MTDNLLTYTEAAQRLGRKQARYIAGLVRSGKLLGVDFGYKHKRIAELDLLRFIDEHKTRGNAPTRRRRGYA